MRTVTRGARLVLLAALLSTLGPRASWANCPFTPKMDLFGTNVWVDDASYLPDLATLKARWIRLECCFDHSDPTHAHYKSIINQVHAAGIKVLLLVDYMLTPLAKPAWSGSDAAWDAYRADWLPRLEEVAQAIGPLADAWELWNEEDHQLSGGYDPGVPAHQFGYLLRDAAKVLRRYSAAPLVVGGLATKRYSYYTDAKTAAGGTLDYDGLGVHTYGPANWTMTTVTNELDLLYSSWYSTAGLPLWVTEAGGQAIPGAEAHAAQYLQTVYDHTWAYHASKVHTIFYFTWRDTPALVGVNDIFGMVDVNGVKRPAFATYAGLTPAYSGGPCTGAGAPPVPAVQAPHVIAPLTMDGDLSDWPASAVPIQLATKDYVVQTKASGGDSDLSATVRFAWDAKYLYVGAVITDDVHQGNQAALQMWQTDSLQIAIDADHDHTAAGYDTDGDTELGFALLSTGPATARWTAPQGAPAFTATLAAKQLATGSVSLEGAVPISALPPLVAQAGTTVGMSLLVNDDDGSGREGWVQWSPGIGNTKNPSLFNHLYLAGTACETTTDCTAPSSCSSLQPPCSCVGGWTCNAAHHCEWECTCGNGKLDAGETCDPPSSCPKSCDDGNACSADVVGGSAGSCNLTCSHSAVATCLSGDGCCPAGCSPLTDADCSAACGNGQLDAGETCDPPSSCAQSCDDGKSCTADLTTGSAANCNVTCSHFEIPSCSDGDGCCPTSCSAATDSDCVVQPPSAEGGCSCRMGATGGAGGLASLFLLGLLRRAYSGRPRPRPGARSPRRRA